MAHRYHYQINDRRQQEHHPKHTGAPHKQVRHPMKNDENDAYKQQHHIGEKIYTNFFHRFQ
jgi:hypothetical protein